MQQYTIVIKIQVQAEDQKEAQSMAVQTVDLLEEHSTEHFFDAAAIAIPFDRSLRLRLATA